MKQPSLLALMLALAFPSSGCLLMPADDNEPIAPLPPPPAPLPPPGPADPAIMPTVERCGHNAPQGLYVSGTLPATVHPNGTTIWIRAVGEASATPPTTATDIFLIAQATDGAFAAACAAGLFDNLWYPWMVAIADANHNGACDAGDVFSYVHFYGWGLGTDEIFEIHDAFDPLDDHFDFGWTSFEAANAAFTRHPHLTGNAASICDII